MIDIDEDCFAQIIINLVDNAIKFSKNAESKVIEIGSKLTGDKQVQFTVDSPNQPSISGFDLVLLDAESIELARVGASKRGLKKIKMRLSPGRYWLGLLATQTHGTEVSYQVIAERGLVPAPQN